MPTDAEIRGQLAEQIEDETREIRVDSPADGPPLILRCRSRVRPEALAHFRQAWQDAWNRPSNGAPRVVVLGDDMELFQLVDGKWTKLG